MFTSTTAAIDKLQKSSDKILNVFTKTITDLTTVNAEVDTNIATRDAEIKRIQDETAKLAVIKEANQKVIDKITKILE